MSRARIADFLGRGGSPFVPVLGTDEIASAIAVRLTTRGFRVAVVRDPVRPVLRRGMAFDDAAHGEPVRLEAVEGIRAERGLDVATILSEPGRVAVVDLDLNEVLAIRSPDALVDARLRESEGPADLRGIAAMVVGVGPGFTVGANCDVAVESRPDRAGRVCREGATAPIGGDPAPSGVAGAEYLVRAPFGGRWRTALDLGRRIYRGMVLGHVDGEALSAPSDGLLRGIVRDDTTVGWGQDLVEIDPRGRDARWRGLDDRGRAIGDGVVRALDTLAAFASLAELAPGDGESLH